MAGLQRGADEVEGVGQLLGEEVVPLPLHAADDHQRRGAGDEPRPQAGHRGPAEGHDGEIASDAEERHVEQDLADPLLEAGLPDHVHQGVQAGDAPEEGVQECDAGEPAVLEHRGL